MINYKLIGIRIAETRKLRGDSQAELAEQVNLSVPYISMIENAKKKVSLQTLIVIAKAMNTSIDALLNGNQDSKHMDYDNEITLVMKDCSNYEQRIIYEQVVSLKSSLRNHRGLLHI
jgi:transcriptional regulator with XRE-family HTH domain